MLTLSNISLWLCVGTSAYILYNIFYAFFLSPVRHVPGPIFSRISKLPLYLAIYRAQRSQYAHKLIEKYGPIVVIAPDQVHTDSDEAMKIIYDRASIKTSFYSRMGSWKGVVSTLGKLDYASAAPTRNNLLQCFQNRNLAQLAEHVDGHVQKFVKIQKDFAKRGQDIDGVVWFRLLALDIVTDVLWGDDTDLLGNADKSTPVFLRRFHAFSKYNALRSFIPGLELGVRLLGSRRWKDLRNDCNDMDATAREALRKWDGNDTRKHDRDVLSMLKSMDMNEDPAKRLPNDHIPAYMVEMMAAGSSTTSHTAAFACWALTRHPDVQQRLREELFEAFPDTSNLDMKASQGLPFLDSVIKETMRLWPMIPGPLERYLGHSTTVNGRLIPPGIIASTAAYTQGRREDVYPSANEWKPERWLQATDEMKLNWIPFGYGSRACPGANLATTELKYMLCAIFRSLRAVQARDHANEPLELMDVFAAGTRSGHCWLRFLVDEETP